MQTVKQSNVGMYLDHLLKQLITWLVFAQQRVMDAWDVLIHGRVTDAPMIVRQSVMKGIDDDVLVFSPTLADKLGRTGVVKAIILQKVYEWQRFNEKRTSKRHYKANRWWMYLSQRAWRDNHLTWLNVKTIQRHISELVDMGFLFTIEAGEITAETWYSVNVKAVQDFARGGQNDLASPQPVHRGGQFVGGGGQFVTPNTIEKPIIKPIFNPIPKHNQYAHENDATHSKNDDVVSSPIQPDDKFLSFSPAHNAMKDCGVSEYMIDELITKYGEDDCLHAAKFAMANGNYPAAMCVHSLKKGWRGDLDPKPMDPKPKTLAKPKTTLTWGNVVIDEMSRNNTDDKRGKYAKFIKTGSDDNWNDWFLREKDTAKSELELFTKRKIQELGAEPNKYISGALGQLELQLNRTSWETYLSDAQIIGLADDMVHLAVKKNYIADMINKRLQRVIAKVMSDCIGKKVSVTAHSMEVKSDTPHFLTNQQYASAS